MAVKPPPKAILILDEAQKVGKSSFTKSRLLTSIKYNIADTHWFFFSLVFGFFFKLYQ